MAHLVVDPAEGRVELSAMPTCIYCRQSKGPFTGEHVIHKGFGRFRDALVIHRAVCDDCNQEFGRTIDLALTRESVEGLERYRFGVKEPWEIERFSYKSVSLRAKNPGDFEGAQFEERADAAGAKVVARLVPTVAVHRKNGEGFVHFTEAKIAEGTWLQDPELDWRRGIKVFGGQDTEKRIKALLESQGVAPSAWRPLTPPVDGEVTVEQVFEVTSDMRRALAKIAFNHLTYCEGTEYALLEQFDSIRRFIRYAEQPSWSLAPVISHEGLPFSTIDAGDVVLRDGPERPVLHFVSLATNAERHVLGAISLFSYMAHRVLLAPGFMARLPTPRAHLYNVAMRRVFQLAPKVEKSAS